MYGVNIQFQTSYECMCSLINNVSHNLAQDQWDATQHYEINLLTLYVSSQHALNFFEVELSNWGIKVVLMYIEVLHNTIIWNGKSKTPKRMKKHLRIGTQSGSCFHILKNIPKLTWCHDYMFKIMYFSMTLIRYCISSLMINHV